jgi:hypothetical protein
MRDYVDTHVCRAVRTPKVTSVYCAPEECVILHAVCDSLIKFCLFMDEFLKLFDSAVVQYVDRDSPQQPGLVIRDTLLAVPLI